MHGRRNTAAACAIMSPRHTALAPMPARWKARGPSQALRPAFATDARKCGPQSPDKNLDGSKLVRQMRRIIGTAGIIIALSVSFSPCLLFLRHMINIGLSQCRVLSTSRPTSLFEHVLFRKTGSHFCGTCSKRRRPAARARAGLRSCRRLSRLLCGCRQFSCASRRGHWMRALPLPPRSGS